MFDVSWFNCCGGVDALYVAVVVVVWNADVLVLSDVSFMLLFANRNSCGPLVINCLALKLISAWV